MHPTQDLFLESFHMYYNLICIFYALLCGQNFILVKSGCYREAMPSKLSKSPLFSRSVFSTSLSFSTVGKEAGRRREIMWEDVGCAWAAASFIASWCNN
jgi:hypothetical protein